MFAKYVPRPVMREYITLILLAVQLIIFGSLNEHFFTASNLTSVVQNAAEIAIVSIGMTFVMLLGGIDLSIGSAMGIIAIVAGRMLQAGHHSLVILLAAVAVGTLIGSINGFIITKSKIPDMIVTLATMNIWRAGIFMMLGGRWLTGLFPDYGAITRARFFGVPVLLIFIILIYLLFYYILMYRKFGRHVYATGSNEHAAELSGINTSRVRLLSYVLSGALVGVAAMLYIARMGSVEMTIGNELNMSAIAAVVIGGAGVKGGARRGSLLGTLGGVFFIAFLRNGIVILGIPSLLENFFIGSLIVISIFSDKLYTQYAKRKKGDVLT